MTDDQYVAVTGATGFIGSNVVKHLTERGEKVLGVDIDVSDDPLFDDYLGADRSRVELVETDLREESRVIGLADHYDIEAVVHAAVFTVVAQEAEARHAREVVETNLMGSVNVLELARRADADRVVYVSSSGVYGSTSDLGTSLTEESTRPYLRDGNLYLVSKVSGEKIVRRYSELFDMTGTSVRIAGPYGPMERPTQTRRRMGPVCRLFRLVVDENRREIAVNGIDYERDWTYSMDTARGIVAALDAPEPSLYNISRGTNRTLEEILTTAQSLKGLEFDWEVVDDTQAADIAIDTGNLRAPLSNRKAVRELDFDPQYDLRDGLEAYYRWWSHANDHSLW